MKHYLHLACIIGLAIYLTTGTGWASSFYIPASSANQFPLKFTQNKGQIRNEQGKIRTDVLFSAAGNGVNFYLTKQGIIYSWKKKDKSKSVLQQVHMELIGANTNVQVLAEDQVPGVTNYFHSAYPQGVTQVQSYQRIVYKEIYPHIDFIIYTNGATLKYDFIVKPGGNPSHIRFTYKGNQNVKIKKNGSLLITNPLGRLMEESPFSYQPSQTDTTLIYSAYHLQNGIVSFQVGRYDTTRPIIIDPAVSWATYYGGEKDDLFSTIKTDDQDNIYAAGLTYSTSDIVLEGALFGSFSNQNSSLLVKFDKNHQLQWATYFGETSWLKDIAIGKNGSVFLCGEVTSLDTQIATISANGHQPLHAGQTDAFLAKLGTDGVPVWSTYYGGPEVDRAEVIVTGPDGNIYITGETNSKSGIATTGTHSEVPLNPDCNTARTNYTECDQDAFIAKFDAETGQRIWGTYFGGTHKEYSYGITVDSQLNVYICGSSISTDGMAFGSYIHQAFKDGTSSSQNLVSSGFLAKFDSNGKGVWGTYYGSNVFDNMRKIAVDELDYVYVLGETFSDKFITSSSDASLNVHQPTKVGGTGSRDVYLVKFDGSGRKIWATYYGGTQEEVAYNLVYNKKGALYLLGNSKSTNTSANYISTGTSVTKYGLRNDLGGGQDIFIAKLDTAGKRVWGAYYGGGGEDAGFGIALNTSGKIYIAGSTKSTLTMPANAVRSERKSDKDALIFSIDDENPLVTLLLPAHQSVNIPTNARLEITFSEPVMLGTGSLNIKQGDKNTIIPVTDASVSIDSNKVIIDASNFNPDTLVEIQVPGSAFTDLSGNPFDGIAAGSWKFTTAPDLTPPQITNKTPQNGGTADKNTKLEIDFDEDVYAGTGSITVVINTIPTVIPVGSASVIINKGKVIINLPELTYNAAVSIQIDSTAFKDPQGNFFKGIPAGLWAFRIGADEITPKVVSFTPVHETDSVEVNTKVEILFDESVSLGPGAITIRQNDIEIPYEDIYANGNKVSIELADFKLGALISIEISDTAIRDVAGNFFAGIPAGSWQFTILPEIKISPEIFEPVSVSHTGSGIDLVSIPTLSIQLNQNPSGTQVALYIRGISDASTDWKQQPVIPSGNTYGITTPIESIDKIGLEYYFEITPPAAYGAAFRSDTGIVYINYMTGLEIPMQPGSKQNQYQLLSIPLDLQDNSISQVFNHLAEPNIEKWRLYRYNNELAKYEEYINTAGFTSIETGRAYWILAREGANFSSGQGSTVKVQQTKPYSIDLQTGWNLIGNPYDMEVSWEDVQTINAISAPGMGELNIYTGGYETGDLKRYSGGFVWADNAMTIHLPVLRNKSLNGGRLSSERPLHHAGSAFEVNFTLQSKDVHYRLGGLGMHPSASSGKDRYDRYLLPRFTDYLDIRFASDTEKTPGFTKQMVPVADEYTWEFIIETSIQPQLMSLAWENYFPEPDGRQLYLYDVVQETIINMHGQQKYTFHSGTSALFRVYYGSPLYISKHLRPQRIKLNPNIPNPFRHETLIPFSLPDGRSEYTVEVSIYNTTGAQVLKLANGKYQPGFHQLKWNGKDTQGNQLPAGLYIARLVVAEEKQNKEMFIRMIIQ